MAEINVGLLEELLLWASDEYAKELAGEWSEWRQSMWFCQQSCGTACCIAGKVAVMSEHRITNGDSVVMEGAWRTIPEFATAELGLQDFAAGRMAPYLDRNRSPRDWWGLFDSDNTLSDLWRWAYLATDGKIDMPEHVVPLAMRSVHERALREFAIDRLLWENR